MGACDPQKSAQSGTFIIDNNYIYLTPHRVRVRTTSRATSRDPPPAAIPPAATSNAALAHTHTHTHTPHVHSPSKLLGERASSPPGCAVVRRGTFIFLHRCHQKGGGCGLISFREIHEFHRAVGRGQREQQH